MTAFFRLDLLAKACDHCYYCERILALLQRRLTASDREAGTFTAVACCSVQRIGGLTLADPVFVLAVCILRRASEMVMVVMTIKKMMNITGDDPRNLVGPIVRGLGNRIWLRSSVQR